MKFSSVVCAALPNNIERICVAIFLTATTYLRYTMMAVFVIVKYRCLRNLLTKWRMALPVQEQLASMQRIKFVHHI